MTDQFEQVRRWAERSSEDLEGSASQALKCVQNGRKKNAVPRIRVSGGVRPGGPGAGKGSGTAEIQTRCGGHDDNASASDPCVSQGVGKGSGVAESQKACGGYDDCVAASVPIVSQVTQQDIITYAEEFATKQAKEYAAAWMAQQEGVLDALQQELLDVRDRHSEQCVRTELAEAQARAAERRVNEEREKCRVLEGMLEESYCLRCSADLDEPDQKAF